MANHRTRTPTSPRRPSPLNELSYGEHSQDHMFTTRGTSLHHFNKPTIRMQDAPSSPVSISPPRQNIREPSSAQYHNYSPPSSRITSRQPLRNVYTPDSTQLDHSISSLSLLDNQAMPEDPDAHVSDDDPNHPDPPPVQLQYAHDQSFDDSPKKKVYRQSQMTVQSAGSSSSGGTHASHLRLPSNQAPRPSSQYTLGADLRRNSYSPMSMEDGPSTTGSPGINGRHLAALRRSPDSRPMSYIDLLNEVPYAQQIAPAPAINHSALQMSVGNSASLLDTNKTLEMYRANVKKTNDPAIQYEFAVFMVNTARDAMSQVEQGARSASPNQESAAEMIKEARSILHRLSDRAYPFAQYYLADGYFSGLFNKGKPDYDKAFPLFVAASKHGHAEAGYRAALCYEFGWGCGQSFPKAVQFFRTAASKGHPGAAVRLGKACLTGDMGLTNKYREGVKWLKRASESADVQYNSGPYELGILHITGFGDDIFKDEAYAAQLLTQAAELGHPEANYVMGQNYENGTLGCPRDASLSVHFYNGAATRGMPEAMMALCAWYMVGAEPILEKDEAEAFEWAKKAADTGLAKAEYAVAYFTEMGIGCRRDPLEANMWYVRAAEQGDATAKQRLAIIRAAASGDTGVPMRTAEAKAKELKGGKEGKEGKEKDCVIM